MKRSLLVYALLVFSATQLIAQSPTGEEWMDPTVSQVNAYHPRTEFISFDVRTDADKNDLSKNPWYMELATRAVMVNDVVTIQSDVNVPYKMLERDMFLQVGGLSSYYLVINGKVAGYGTDNRTPRQFLVTEYLTDGNNQVELRVMNESVMRDMETLQQTNPTPSLILFSQPRTRIDDFVISARPDSTNDHGILDIAIVVTNGYNVPEEMTVGYDIYSPQGKLQYYDMKEVTVRGNSMDTVYFSELIYGTPDNLWSAEKPALYYGMLTVKVGNRMLEYIPYKVGFGTTEQVGDRIYRNGKPVELRVITYNASNRNSASADLDNIKKNYNTVMVDYPQPMWFYELCASKGIYVIDQSNVNNHRVGGDRNVGGAVSNDPAWLGTFLDRQVSMYERTKNMTCVVARSIGGNSGNGYNMYRSYLLLKDMAPDKIVIYNDAQGEWNTDLPSFNTAR